MNKAILQIAQLAVFSKSYLVDEIGESTYRTAGYETAGYMIACAIRQWLNISDGVGTVETIEALNLSNYSKIETVDEMVELVEQFVKTFKD